MKLTPDERQVGIENFYAVAGSKLTRAEVLKETVAGELASGRGLGSRYFRYGEVERPVRVGIIGTGDEGNVLIGSLNPKYVQVVAIADIRPYNIYRAFNGDKTSAGASRARPGLVKVYGWADEKTAREQVNVYADSYEELLDDEQVEAVIVALPLHLHAEASIKAMRKGKHVLCEKLMAHSIHQCKEMARVADEENKLLAIGHQRHYSVLYDTAVDLVKKNVLGRIHHIRAQWHRNNLPGDDSWQQPLPNDAMKAELEDAQTKLSEAKGKFEKAKAEAKKKLPQKTLDLLAKWDVELVEQPKKLAAAVAKLAEESAKPEADQGLIGKFKEEIGKREKRISDINREYPKRLQLDPKVAAELDVPSLETKVGVLSHRIQDAEIGTKCKDYGYIDRNVGGSKVSALEELIRWRLWDRTGGGLMAELGSHQLDAAGIFISAMRDDGKKARPLSVTGVGGRHVFPHDRDIDDHVYCSFEYPAPDYDPEKAPEKKIVVSYSSINGNGYGGYGETVLGTRGTLVLDREKDVMLYISDNSATSKYVRVTGKGKDLKLSEWKPGTSEAGLAREALKGPISRGYTEEIEHWAWAILEKSKKAAAQSSESESESEPVEIAVPLRCSPNVALADAVIALTANIALERGGKQDENCRIRFKDEWFEIDSDETPEGVAPDTKRPEYEV